MKTKLLLTLTSLTMAALGLAATFAPQEIAVKFSGAPGLVNLLQILGGLYVGFAMLNWMSRGALVGGIYSRPLVVANLTHFTVAGLALAKSLLSRGAMIEPPALALGLTLAYALFAIWFGLVLRTAPTSTSPAPGAPPAR